MPLFNEHHCSEGTSEMQLYKEPYEILTHKTALDVDII
jgi:hypothetical protein